MLFYFQAWGCKKILFFVSGLYLIIKYKTMGKDDYITIKNVELTEYAKFCFNAGKEKKKINEIMPFGQWLANQIHS